MRHPVAALLALTLFCIPSLQGSDEHLQGWFDLPVPGGLETLEALGIVPEERAVAIPLLARALQERDTRAGMTPAEVAAALAAGQAAGPSDITIPVPLTAELWQELLPPPDGDLFTRLLSDRAALTLAAGLASTDDSVRDLLANNRSLLRFVYERASGAFVVVARRLRIDEGGMVVPGGKAAEAIWTALVRDVTRPEAFLRILLTRDAGRLAWYYDTIGGLDDARLRAVWGGFDRAQAAALYEVFRNSDPHWRLNDQPFRRTVVDAWTLVTQIDVADGKVVSPLSQPVWDVVFSNARIGRGQAMYALRAPAADVSLAWVAWQVVMAPRLERPRRFEMFRVAQRVFANAAASTLPDVAAAVSAMREHRALLLTLERMQVTHPETWILAADAARHASTAAENPQESLIAFQAALALVERIRHVRTVDAGVADRLVRSLSETVQRDRAVTRAVAEWLTGSLVPTLPRLRRPDQWTGATAYESTILQALAGTEDAAEVRLEWEGLPYLVDVTVGEHERLRAMRALLPSPGLDAAIADGRPRDLASALVVLVYATALGDPQGPASLSPDVPARHDFGFTQPPLLRDTLPWAIPEERQGIGTWRVQGALLGLDLALSRLQLRRLADQQMPLAPTLTLNDLSTLTRTAVMLVPSELTDAARDELAAAIARGRQRIAGADSAEALIALSRESGQPHYVAQVLPWMHARQPEAIPAMFALRDQMWLGAPQLPAGTLDRWGVSGEGLDGRRTTTMPRPVSWEDYTGRSEAGQVTTQVPDLTLRLVEETARLGLPARLIPALLGFALEDYWHNVQARFADDWPQLAREAARLESARIVDYVAALTANGPLQDGSQ